MANYTFLDASGNTQTAASSTIGGVEYPIVMVPNQVSVVGTIKQYGTTSISGLVNINSVIGTYDEDSQHTTGQKGFFTLAVRNDTLSSVTSLDNDYSPVTVGPVGETIVASAPMNKWVYGTASVVTGAVMTQPVIAAQGASVFTYVKSMQFANFGIQSVLVAVTAAAASAGSILTWVTVPASNTVPIQYEIPIKSAANGAITVSVIGAAVPSLFVAAQGFTAKI